MGEAISTSTGIDSLLLCPQTGGPCPIRERMAALYTENIEEDFYGMPEDAMPMLNGMKLGTRLAEHKAQAALRGCEGETEGSCPVWTAMTESKVRQTAVAGIKKFIGSKRK